MNHLLILNSMEDLLSFYFKVFILFVIPRACFGGLAVLLKFWAAKRMKYGNSVALASLVPIFAPIFSKILWKEELSIFTILSFLVGLGWIVRNCFDSLTYFSILSSE